MIYVESRKRSLKNLQNKYPQATIIDVTSKGKEPWIKVSPFYPHGKIPIPFSAGYYGDSVEGIWQGLKVFEKEDIDESKFSIRDMKGIKRTVRKFGKPLGHRKGVNGIELLDYLTARKDIYLRTYGWMLDNKASDVIQLLKIEAEKNDLVLLDFDTNGDIDNLKKPLSHAALVKRYIEKKYPELAHLTFEANAPAIDYLSKLGVTAKKTKAAKSSKKVKGKKSSNDSAQLTLL